MIITCTQYIVCVAFKQHVVFLPDHVPVQLGGDTGGDG